MSGLRSSRFPFLVMLVVVLSAVGIGWKLSYGQTGGNDQLIVVKNFRYGAPTIVCEADALVAFEDGEPVAVVAVRDSAQDRLDESRLTEVIDNHGHVGLSGNIWLIEVRAASFVPGTRNCSESPDEGGDAR